MTRDMLLKNIEDAYKKLGKEIPNGLSAKEYFNNLTNTQLGAKLRDLVFEIDHPNAQEVSTSNSRPTEKELLAMQKEFLRQCGDSWTIPDEEDEMKRS